jgi:imidazoleglycerol-phosphate dehydratase/histidinol-phosphatase
MSRKILFVDRDGCLIHEPADEQIDSYEKLDLLPEVIAALQRIVGAGYELVMVTNQDGLGTERFPETNFQGPHDLLLRILSSQGIRFREVLIDRSFPHDGLDTRKPGIGLTRHYLADDSWLRTESAMVGDRETDLQFAANMGVRGFRVGPNGIGWADMAHQLLDRPRMAEVVRHTKETRIKECGSRSRC